MNLKVFQKSNNLLKCELVYGILQKSITNWQLRITIVVSLSIIN